jgi:hypothetical protein
MADVDEVRRNSMLVRNLMREELVRSWFARNGIQI